MQLTENQFIIFNQEKSPNFSLAKEFQCAAAEHFFWNQIIRFSFCVILEELEISTLLWVQASK